MPEARRLLLAFDYGLKRIGVATGNRLTGTASPLTTLKAAGGPPWKEIDALVTEWRPDLIIVGRPGADADARLLESLDDFVAGLSERYALEIEQVDESFTSAAAESALREDRRDGILQRRVTRAEIDRRAACLIAEQWMNQSLE
ncbi:MAG TPA: Holliday junction resolvase RuvX [Gammaproteobacteria bacterium]|nr:Holliday junction resolvase RuvX [Gammaproteobacteria bacterium]